MGAGGAVLEEVESSSERERSVRYVEINDNTLEWKCGLVMGLVSISYLDVLAGRIR